jgi:hypothetical protein
MKIKKHEHMSKTPIQKDKNENILESKNKLTYIANRNCASPSSGDEEQIPSLVEGQRVERCVLAQVMDAVGRFFAN